jgi:hypothetical protein
MTVSKKWKEREKLVKVIDAGRRIEVKDEREIKWKEFIKNERKKEWENERKQEGNNERKEER